MDENIRRSQAANEVRKEFEDALRKHVRRLAGINHEFSNILMSLDLLTLSCTVLIVEREKELHVNKDDPPKRYTENSLLHALAELGLDDLKKVRLILQVLIQKKYIIETKEGLAATEPAFKLSIFFDTIFPNMPGLNLIVYFNQIGDEVLSNRKTIELALAQINKTLKTQGVSLMKKVAKKKPVKKKGIVSSGITKINPQKGKSNKSSVMSKSQLIQKSRQKKKGT
jgi:DNA topoisomerase IA